MRIPANHRMERNADRPDMRSLFTSFFIFAMCLSLWQQSFGQTGFGPAQIDTSTWEISLEVVFPGDTAANPFVAKLIDQLGRADRPGQALSVDEFRQLCSRASPQVYARELVRYGTPASVKLQDQDHARYARSLMQSSQLQAGVRFLRQYDDLLRKAQREYGVHRKDIVSILMWESGLGRVSGDKAIFNIFVGQILYLEEARQFAVEQELNAGNPDSLVAEITATEKQRLERIRNRAAENLAALLRNAKASGIDPLEIVGSWGGAIGYVQFMPQSLPLAVDGDLDGDIDLYSWPDAIPSVANYLRENGYQTDHPSRRRAILRYNPLGSYADGVIAYADAIWKRYLGR
jgi:membrane-bound lytic murein transglycosylase B